MAFLSRSRYFLCSLLLLGSVVLPQALRAQEIPLEHCDALPVITVKIGDRPSLFLVDTAATSMLNLASFAEGSAKDIRVTSWTGTLATSAKEVALEELAVGRTTLLKLKLPAIDLSAIGKACGKKIDGILGVDLLSKLGASINLKQQTLHLATTDEKRGEELVTAMQIEMHRCLEAFNESDEQAFGDCLDPKIVLFSGEAELYGREQVTGYFREKYFHQKPAAKLDIRESSFHSIGEAIWYEYEFTIDSSRGRLRGRGMAMCKKSEGRWRMASMHHSILEWQSAEAGSENSQ
jgi:ketosteroid isomerase-like protein/predicted aspartyl protease